MPSSDNVYHRLDRANTVVRLLRDTVELQRQREAMEREITAISERILRLRCSIMTLLPESGEM